MKKRILSVLLAVCMVAGLLPVLAQPALAGSYSKSIADSSLFFKDDGSGGTQYSTDNTNWTDYSGSFTITGSSTSDSEVKNTVIVYSGTHNIILSDCSIGAATATGEYVSDAFSPFDVQSGAIVTLTLSGSNQLYSANYEKAGLRVQTGAALTITGSGALDARCQKHRSAKSFFGWGAGIGGNTGQASVTIIINGGTVSAYSLNGAGIGGGKDVSFQSFGTVTINGGTVFAQTDNGCGIGYGYGAGTNGKNGTVTITGGTVNAILGQTGNTNPQIGGTVQNTSNTAVKLYTLTLPAGNKNTPVTSLTTTPALGDTYGTTDMETDTDGKLYVYLPAGKTEVTVTTDSGTYAGNITDNAATLTQMTTYSATVTLKKNNGTWTGDTPTIQLSTSPTELTDAVTGTLLSNVYTFNGLVEGTTYYVWEDGTTATYTGQSVSSSSPTATVNYYIVAFNAEYGEVILGNQTVLSGQPAVFGGSTPTKSSTAQYTYAFSGWAATIGGSADPTLNNVTAAKAVYAIFTQATRTYTITWKSDASTTIDTTTVDYGNTPTHADPAKTGYTFNVWSPAIANVTGATTYTATWTATTNDITYTLNGGTASNPASYTVASSQITLTNPTRSNYTFVGWSGTGLTGNTNQTVTIPTGSTGSKSYTANWKANTPSAPLAGIVTAKTDTSMTITTQDSYEYSVNGTDWYSGTGSYTFNGLISGTAYGLVCRVAAVSTGNSPSAASDASAPLSVTTKSAPAQAPAAPWISAGPYKPTSTSITISSEADYEYYISESATADWSGTPTGYFEETANRNHTFTNLTPATQYYVYVRRAGTSNAMPSNTAYAAQYTLPTTPAADTGYSIDYTAEKITVNGGYEVNTKADFSGTAVASNATLTPGATYYVRVAATGSVPASEAVSFTVSPRPATPEAITTENITKTDTTITIATTISTQEYSIDGGTTWKTGNGGALGFSGLAAGQDCSVVTRTAAAGATFASEASLILSVTTKTAPVQLTDSNVTYSVKNGTIIGLGSTYEYSLDGGMTWLTAPTTGVTFAAGNTVLVRTIETDTAMPSQPQTLGTIAAAAQAPAFAINYAAETTTAAVPTTAEYKAASAAEWTSGTDAMLALIPGVIYYFRMAATDAALPGAVQTLAAPARPSAPATSVATITAGDNAAHTSLTLAGSYEYILADTLPGVSDSGNVGPGSATEITATDGLHVFVRVKAVADAFASDWTDCGAVFLGIDDISFTGVGYDVAAGTLTGTTTNMQYSLDGGTNWQDCTAPDTTGLTFAAGIVKVRQKDKTTNERIVGSIEAAVASSAPTLSSKTSSSVTLTAMSGYEYSKDGGVTWQDSNVFSGLSGSTAYSFAARIKATAATLPGTISTAFSVTTDSTPVSGGTGGSTAPAAAPVIVDGKTVNIGTATRAGDATTVTVDQSKLSTNISGAASGSSVVVPVSAAGAATAALVVKNIEDMAKKDMTLTVQTGNVTYNLAASAIDTAALTAAFPGADMSKVPFDVTVTNSAVTVSGETLVVLPMAFTVTATYSGKTVSVDTFSAYVDREVEVTAQQAARITTAVVVNADGSVRHVPTNVVHRDGKWYAIMNSRTNSTYALIENAVTFADAKGKWFESAVNEMGSRKIISGRGTGTFDGDANITRAEFSAILVRALGLPDNGTSAFSDVSSDAWYAGAVATAAQYGIVTGKGDNRFDPTANITRQEAMLMLKRAAALAEFAGAVGKLDGFSDAASVGAWAEDAASWNVGSGLIQGADGKLNPTLNITRAESATIILRLLQKAGLVDVRSKA